MRPGRMVSLCLAMPDPPASASSLQRLMVIFPTTMLLSPKRAFIPAGSSPISGVINFASLTA